MPLSDIALLFAIVFLLNTLPAFAPPTWLVISYIGIRWPDSNVLGVAVCAALAATLGRIVLSRFAWRFALSRWCRPGSRDNLTYVAKRILRRRTTTALGFLLFALSPVPSNVLFLAYGLTRAPIWLLATPFFLGRCVSYTVAFAGGSMASDYLGVRLSSTWGRVYFICTQLLLLACLYAFTRVDWRRSVDTRRLCWRPWHD